MIVFSFSSLSSFENVDDGIVGVRCINRSTRYGRIIDVDIGDIVEIKWVIRDKGIRRLRSMKNQYMYPSR